MRLTVKPRLQKKGLLKLDQQNSSSERKGGKIKITEVQCHVYQHQIVYHGWNWRQRGEKK